MYQAHFHDHNNQLLSTHDSQDNTPNVGTKLTITDETNTTRRFNLGFIHWSLQGPICYYQQLPQE